MTTATANPQQLLTAREVAKRWQLLDKDNKPNTSAVYRMTREGLIKPVRLGRYVRFDVKAIEEFEAKGGTGPGDQRD